MALNSINRFLFATSATSEHSLSPDKCDYSYKLHTPSYSLPFDSTLFNNNSRLKVLLRNLKLNTPLTEQTIALCATHVSVVVVVEFCFTAYRCWVSRYPIRLINNYLQHPSTLLLGVLCTLRHGRSKTEARKCTNNETRHTGRSASSFGQSQKIVAEEVTKPRWTKSAIATRRRTEWPTRESINELWKGIRTGSRQVIVKPELLTKISQCESIGRAQRTDTNRIYSTVLH